MMACSPANTGPSTISSITPNVLQPGQTYDLVITGNFPGDEPEDVLPGCTRDEDSFSLTPPQPFGWTIDEKLKIRTDQGFTADSGFAIGTFSPTQITLTIKVAPDHPSGLVYLVLNCDGCDYQAFGGPIQIAGPGPKITAISPSAWFAGRSYDVTITGTNFTTASDSGGPTELKVTNQGFGVEVTNVVVVSSTQITATIKPNKKSPAGSAIVKVTNSSTGSNPGSGEAAQTVLPQPTIYDWNYNAISGDGATPDSVLVGQPINLSTDLPDVLPGGFTITKHNWTVGGTNIGGYSPSAAKADPPTRTIKNQASLNTYWVYQDVGVKVKYKYCTSAQDLDNPCSDEETATFNIGGPPDAPMSTEPYSAMVINRTIDRQPCLPSDIDFWLQYGVVTGYDDEACPGLGGESGIPGMKFTAPDDSSNGSYSFVQIVNKSTTTYVEGTNGKLVCPTSPGLDGIYPYPPVALGTTNDSPNVLLEPFYSKVRRTFEATMYMMWTSNTAGSIPVPISSQAWQFVQASTTNSGYPTSENWTEPMWTLIGLTGDPTDYVATAPNTSPYGYPTWKHLATPVANSLCPTANSAEEEETEEP